jgi:hypothetical protein
VSERRKHLGVLVWGCEVDITLGMSIRVKSVNATTGRWTYRWGFPEVVSVLFEEGTGGHLDGIGVGFVVVIVIPPETIC